MLPARPSCSRMGMITAVEVATARPEPRPGCRHAESSRPLRSRRRFGSPAIEGLVATSRQYTTVRQPPAISLQRGHERLDIVLEEECATGPC